MYITPIAAIYKNRAPPTRKNRMKLTIVALLALAGVSLAAPKPDCKTHKVKYGDTCWKVARDVCDIDFSEFKRYNTHIINLNEISAGAYLCCSDPERTEHMSSMSTDPNGFEIVSETTVYYTDAGPEYVTEESSSSSSDDTPKRRGSHRRHY